MVCQNKVEIKKAITSCLEEPLHQMLTDWINHLKTDDSVASELDAEIEAIRKHLSFDNKFSATASVLPSVGTTNIIPDDIKYYLFRYIV